MREIQHEIGLDDALNRIGQSDSSEDENTSREKSNYETVDD